MCDVYVNDAFGSAHRRMRHGGMIAFVNRLRRLLMDKEIEY